MFVVFTAIALYYLSLGNGLAEAALLRSFSFTCSLNINGYKKKQTPLLTNEYGIYIFYLRFLWLH